MPATNLLLSAMPHDARELLRSCSKTVELPHGQVLHRPGQTIEQVYFPLTALISITITMQDGRTSEAGVVGSREMVGVNAFMGGRETNQTEYVAQVAGTAVRMPADPLLEEFNRNKALRDVMLRYTQAYLAQLSQNVACNRMHSLEQRMARWLLESRDRLQSEELNLTQEFLGQMLGVRRAGVSETAQAMQDRGLIKRRKVFRILDSVGLEATSCECYCVIRDEYDRLLGSMREDANHSNGHA